jgi:hypothetical protein
MLLTMNAFQWTPPWIAGWNVEVKLAPLSVQELLPISQNTFKALKLRLPVTAFGWKDATQVWPIDGPDGHDALTAVNFIMPSNIVSALADAATPAAIAAPYSTLLQENFMIFLLSKSEAGVIDAIFKP